MNKHFQEFHIIFQCNEARHYKSIKTNDFAPETNTLEGKVFVRTHSPGIAIISSKNPEFVIIHCSTMG